MSLITSSVRMGDTGKPAMSGISYLRDYISRGGIRKRAFIFVTLDFQAWIFSAGE